MSSNRELEQLVWQALKQVLDPELRIDIVSLGLVYKVAVKHSKKTLRPTVTITMTLTSPGCPLADSFDGLIRQQLENIKGLDIEEDVVINLTFDPPWVFDMMTDEAKAELGMI